MGMPTIKMPAGVAPAATARRRRAGQDHASMAVPPIAPTGDTVAPAGTVAGAAPPARAPPRRSGAGRRSAPPSRRASARMNRAPMVSGTPTKRSALVERTLAKMAARLAEAAGLEPGSPELLALLKLSTEVVERIVWEVVPELAEQIIRENLHDLTRASQLSVAALATAWLASRA